MTYNATVFSVMIASPSDVTKERNRIREVIHEWNDINSKNTESVLLPVGWETHSAPDMSGPAQGVINKKVEHCDLLVGVFWARLGTPTVDFESGTVEEIKRHIGKGKPAMVYFSSAPLPQSYDQTQWAALGEFKQWCLGQGLIESYDGISDFSDKFRRQLQMTVLDKLGLANSTSLGSVDFVEVYRSARDGAIDERLSDEAKRLLIEAAKDPSGTIIQMRHLDGQAIQTNGINFADSKDRRSIARWEAALEQLKSEELIVERGYKAEIFEITDKGYEVVGALSQAAS